MRNPEQTREAILKRSGLLFNTRGYKATSISNITDATGFTKGAIYRHFKDKEHLERESLFYLSSLMFDNVRTVIKDQPTADRKLRALFRYFESYITNPPIKGGCPLLNVAVESDDAHPFLRKEALKVLDILRDSLIRIMNNGIKYKQFKSSIDTDYYATIFIATLEGAIMMSKLRKNNEDIRKVIRHLEEVIDMLKM